MDRAQFWRQFWRRRGDSNPRDPFEPNGFQDRRFQPLTHSSVSKYNLPQLLAGRLVTILESIAAFWCTLSPNCHQNFRVSRPPPSLNRDLYACSAWLSDNAARISSVVELNSYLYKGADLA